MCKRDRLNDSGTVTQEELETLLGESESAPAPGAKRTSFTSARTAFHERLFALLLRYKSILGYGFQAGVGPLVFSALQKTIGTQFELFASPLNAFHTKGFCSAFPDVDGCFGSRGDFFDIFEYVCHAFPQSCLPVLSLSWVLLVTTLTRIPS